MDLGTDELVQQVGDPHEGLMSDANVDNTGTGQECEVTSYHEVSASYAENFHEVLPAIEAVPAPADSLPEQEDGTMMELTPVFPTISRIEESTEVFDSNSEATFVQPSCDSNQQCSDPTDETMQVCSYESGVLRTSSVVEEESFLTEPFAREESNFRIVADSNRTPQEPQEISVEPNLEEFFRASSPPVRSPSPPVPFSPSFAAFYPQDSEVEVADEDADVVVEPIEAVSRDACTSMSDDAILLENDGARGVDAASIGVGTSDDYYLDEPFAEEQYSPDFGNLPPLGASFENLGDDTSNLGPKSWDAEAGRIDEPLAGPSASKQGTVLAFDDMHERIVDGSNAALASPATKKKKKKATKGAFNPIVWMYAQKSRTGEKKDRRRLNEALLEASRDEFKKHWEYCVDLVAAGGGRAFDEIEEEVDQKIYLMQVHGILPASKEKEKVDPAITSKHLDECIEAVATGKDLISADFQMLNTLTGFSVVESESDESVDSGVVPSPREVKRKRKKKPALKPAENEEARPVAVAKVKKKVAPAKVLAAKTTSRQKQKPLSRAKRGEPTASTLRCFYGSTALPKSAYKQRVPSGTFNRETPRMIITSPLFKLVKQHPSAMPPPKKEPKKKKKPAEKNGTTPALVGQANLVAANMPKATSVLVKPAVEQAKEKENVAEKQPGKEKGMEKKQEKSGKKQAERRRRESSGSSSSLSSLLSLSSDSSDDEPVIGKFKAPLEERSQTENKKKMKEAEKADKPAVPDKTKPADSGQKPKEIQKVAPSKQPEKKEEKPTTPAPKSILKKPAAKTETQPSSQLTSASAGSAALQKKGQPEANTSSEKKDEAEKNAKEDQLKTPEKKQMLPLSAERRRESRPQNRLPLRSTRRRPHSPSSSSSSSSGPGSRSRSSSWSTGTDTDSDDEGFRRKRRTNSGNAAGQSVEDEALKSRGLVKRRKKRSSLDQRRLSRNVGLELRSSGDKKVAAKAENGGQRLPGSQLLEQQARKNQQSQQGQQQIARAPPKQQSVKLQVPVQQQKQPLQPDSKQQQPARQPQQQTQLVGQQQQPARQPQQQIQQVGRQYQTVKPQLPVREQHLRGVQQQQQPVAQQSSHQQASQGQQRPQQGYQANSEQQRQQLPAGQQVQSGQQQWPQQAPLQQQQSVQAQEQALRDQLRWITLSLQRLQPLLNRTSQEPLLLQAPPQQQQHQGVVYANQPPAVYSNQQPVLYQGQQPIGYQNQPPSFPLQQPNVQPSILQQAPVAHQSSYRHLNPVLQQQRPAAPLAPPPAAHCHIPVRSSRSRPPPGLRRVLPPPSMQPPSSSPSPSSSSSALPRPLLNMAAPVLPPLGDKEGWARTLGLDRETVDVLTEEDFERIQDYAIRCAEQLRSQQQRRRPQLRQAAMMNAWSQGQSSAQSHHGQNGVFRAPPAPPPPPAPRPHHSLTPPAPQPQLWSNSWSQEPEALESSAQSVCQVSRQIPQRQAPPLIALDVSGDGGHDRREQAVQAESPDIVTAVSPQRLTTASCQTLITGEGLYVNPDHEDDFLFSEFEELALPRIASQESFQHDSHSDADLREPFETDSEADSVDMLRVRVAANRGQRRRFPDYGGNVPEAGTSYESAAKRPRMAPEVHYVEEELDLSRPSSVVDLTADDVPLPFSG